MLFVSKDVIESRIKHHESMQIAADYKSLRQLQIQQVNMFMWRGKDFGDIGYLVDEEILKEISVQLRLQIQVAIEQSDRRKQLIFTGRLEEHNHMISLGTHYIPEETADVTNDMPFYEPYETWDGDEYCWVKGNLKETKDKSHTIKHPII